VNSGTTLVFGASGAVGSALCQRLAEAGRPVAAAGRNYERLNEALGPMDLPLLVADARDSSQVRDAIQEVKDGPDGLGAVVNCVGSLLLKPAHATSDEEWTEVLETNLGSAFLVVKHGAAALQRSGGAIVLVSSAAASTGLPNHEAIAAAKSGVEGLTRSAAATYAARNLRVNAVAPGLVRSGMTASLFEDQVALGASKAMHPLGRPGEPAEIASAIEWLLDAEWVTGQVLGVDGGLSRARPRMKL
jgi:3-oxoacyl-[acyl-carrier protein] reductase